jgi:hypothetical protein
VTDTPTQTATRPPFIGDGGPETCDNGVDDNANALVDCADPLCLRDTRCSAPVLSPTLTALLVAMLATLALVTLGIRRRGADDRAD